MPDGRDYNTSYRLTRNRLRPAASESGAIFWPFPTVAATNYIYSKKLNKMLIFIFYISAAMPIFRVMTHARAYSGLIDRLKDVGLRPTRQRLALAKLLFGGGNRHLTAEQLHAEAIDQQIPVSLATVYNALHQFTQAGLLREVVVDPGRSYFDTNVDDHHHFFFQDSGRLEDIPGERVRLGGLPAAPRGTRVARVDVIVRLESGDK